ncbi:MAG TPA: NAD-dependent epimerase/dehydratase family protein [Polyangia bacterium]
MTVESSQTTALTGPLTLVTGATGFLGAHLVRALVARGLGPVRAMQSSAPPAWLTASGVEVVRGSVTSPDDVARALQGVGRVYHLAGQVSMKPTDGHRMYQLHVDGTRILCRAAAERGVRRIVLSSTSGTIAVSRRADAGLDESSPPPIELIARWPYYASKLYQEEAARRACSDKVELVMLNPSLLLGPGDDRLSSTRTVLQFLGREIAITPPGGLNFVDVRDVAEAFIAAMDRGTPGERYLLGGMNCTFSEYFGRLERITKVAGPLLKGRGNLTLWAARAQAALYKQLGKSVPVEPAAVEMASHYWYFESTKAARDLGFLAREASDTLHDTVRYLRENFLGGHQALTRAS